MKKILFLLAALPFFFTACSSDDEEGGSTTKFIQIIVTSDDAIAPKGKIALFWLNKGESFRDCPTIVGDIVSGYTVSDDFMIPISKRAGDDLRSSSNDNYSVKTYYTSEFGYTTYYGTPRAGKYAIFIQSSEGNKPRVYKEFEYDWTNKKVTVHIPSASKLKECVEGQWVIEDYKY